MGIRVTQTAVEVLVQSDAPRERVTQTAAEALVQPDVRRTRVTQTAIEALAQSDTRRVRVTQTAVEALIGEPPPAQNLDRTASDSSTASDSIASGVGTSRSASDSTATSESIASIFGASREASDTASASESVARALVAAREVADSSVTTDTIASEGSGAQEFTRSAVDTISISESVDRMLQAARSLSDSTTTDDAISSDRDVTRAASDSLTTSDALASSGTAPRSLQDSTTTSESVARALQATRTLSDTVSTTESASATRDVARSATETLTTSETLAHAGGALRTLQDSALYVQDTVSRALVATRAATETLYFLDFILPFALSAEDAAEPDPQPSVLVPGVPLANLTIGGVDFTADVMFDRCRFTTGANGQAGTAEIWIRDLEHTRSVTTGKEVVVRFRGIRQWGGYVANVRRQYAFGEGSGVEPEDEVRFLVVDGVDYNVLFNKRVFFDPADTDDMYVKRWPLGTWDSVVIGQLVSQFLTLGGDGISFDVRHVGTPAERYASCNPDAPDVFGIGLAGWLWGEVMNSIVSATGAVYYIDPDKVFRYVDDSTKQSRFGYTGITDSPSGLMVGYRDFDHTRDGSRLNNDHYQWGAGQGSADMVFAHEEDAASQAAHGLWQGAELRYDMYCQESVDRRAETWLYGSPQNRRGHKDDRNFARATIFKPYFRPADVLAVESTEFGISDTMPVRYSEISFPTPWDIKTVLTIGHEIDAPWQTHEFWLPLLNLNFPPFDFDYPRIDPGPGLWFEPPVFDPCLFFGSITLGELLGLPGFGEGGGGGSSVLDAFERAIGLGRGAGQWGTADNGENWTTVFTLLDPASEGGGGVNGGYGFLRLEPFAGDGPVWANLNAPEELGEGSFDITFDFSYFFTAAATPGQSAAHHVTLGIGGGSDSPADDAAVDVFVDGINTSTGWIRLHDDSIASAVDLLIQPNTVYSVRWERNVDEGVSRAKIWTAGTSEPTAWDVTDSPWSGAQSHRLSYYMHPQTNSTAFGGDIIESRVHEIRATSSLCADTFSREEEDGWGTSEICGYEWVTQSQFPNANFVADGKAQMLTSGWKGANYLNLPESSIPIEMTGRGSITRPVNSPDFGWFISLDTRNLPRELLRIESRTAGRFDDFPQGNHIFSISRGSGMSGVTYTTPWTEFDNGASSNFAFRWQIDPTEVRVKLWNPASGEPSTWLWVATFTSAFDPTHIRADAGDGFALSIDRLAITCTCGGNPCDGLGPGELADQPTGGSQTGEEAARAATVGPNGGTIFFVDHQYQKGSSQVWVDGRRIRLGLDYIEYPRTKRIEVLSHVTLTESSVVSVNYQIWTIEDPAPSVEPI